MKAYLKLKQETVPDMISLQTVTYATGFDTWVARVSDQPLYCAEFAKVWRGRLSRSDPGPGGRAEALAPPPHTFVIGHTHMRLLQYIVVVG